MREELVREVRVLREDVGGEVVVSVLAVEQQQVAEGLGRERRVREQEVELAESRGGVRLDVDEGLVVQRLMLGVDELFLSLHVLLISLLL